MSVHYCQMQQSLVVILQWRSQKLCVKADQSAGAANAKVESRRRRLWGWVCGGVSPPQPTRGSGSVAAPLVGSSPRSQMHFLHILGNRTLLVGGKT